MTSNRSFSNHAENRCLQDSPAECQIEHHFGVCSCGHLFMFLLFSVDCLVFKILVTCLKTKLHFVLLCSLCCFAVPQRISDHGFDVLYQVDVPAIKKSKQLLSKLRLDMDATRSRWVKSKDSSFLC